MKVAYVVATWGGARAQRDFDHVRILRGHFAQLDQLNHSSDVFLIVPDNTTKAGNVPGFDEEVARIEARGDVAVIRRPNIGQSYGGYNDVFARYRDAYDVYIFYEDDYYPVGNHFDSIWRTMFEETADDVGMICGRVGTVGVGPHASISICACPSWALQRVWDKYGCIPHWHKTCEGWRKEWYNCQVGFSRSFLHAGMKLDDVVSFGYKAPFWNSRKHRIHCADEYDGGPFLFFPAQCFDQLDERRALCGLPTS